MTNPFSIITEALGALFALVFPMFAQARSRELEAASPLGRWLARALVVAFFLGFLWLLNESETFGLKYWVRGRLGEFWLPLFVLCLYAMTWLGWRLYCLLTLQIPTIGSPFPDIDAAWNQACEALAKAEISLLDTPLFLIFGWNAGSDEAMFKASRMRLVVEQVPKGSLEPLRVSANREAIWITCGGASSLAQHNPALGGGGSVGTGSEETLAALVDDTGTGSEQRTYGAGGGRETLRIEDIMKGPLGEIIRRQRKGIPAKQIADPELHKARLQHLCQLINRDRQGLCPVNGMLVLLSITAAAPKADIQGIAASCRSDLSLALETLRIRCPILFAVCDLETLPGFTELVERLPSKQASSRVGQRFPLVPDLSPGEVPAKIQSSVLFMTEALFPTMVYSLFAVDAPGGEDVADVLRANGQLFRFLTALRDRQDRLAQLVKECLPPTARDPQLFGGCYFTGNGDAKTGSAFAPGVFARMIQDQDRVTWTADYLEEDAASHRLAGYLRTFFIAALGLGSALALYWLYSYLSNNMIGESRSPPD
jgi:hypothetical protein